MWWDGLGVGTRSDMLERYQDLFGASPDDEFENSIGDWAERIAECAAVVGIRIDVASTPMDRLVAIYERIVNERTGYTGLLIVMDEFASWQDQRPEGGSAYSEDENLLQTLAETLPRDLALNVLTVGPPKSRCLENSRADASNSSTCFGLLMDDFLRQLSTQWLLRLGSERLRSIGRLR